MRGTISRRGQSTPTQRLWINQNDFLQVGLHRMADSTRLLICTNPERGHLSGCEFTRKSSQEYGHTTASSISLILGANVTNTVKYLSTALLLSRETKVLTVHRSGTFSVAELYLHL